MATKKISFNERMRFMHTVWVELYVFVKDIFSDTLGSNTTWKTSFACKLGSQLPRNNYSADSVNFVINLFIVQFLSNILLV